MAVTRSVVERRHTYLDFAATTPLDADATAAMIPWMQENYGNPSSVHALGRRARAAVEASREAVAAILGASPSEIVFTSGGTEANNLAIMGATPAGAAIITSRVEHEAVLRPAERMGQRGRDLRYVSVRHDGTVDADELARTLSATASRPVLVSLMHVNNETGALNDVKQLAEVAHRAGAIIHTDAVQSVGLLDVDVDSLGVDLLSISAHKFYGPKGAGALYVRSGVAVEGQLVGGRQERARRAGTENVAGIVGLAKALEKAAEYRDERRIKISALRDRLIARLQGELADVLVLNTPAGEQRLAPHIVNVSIRSEGADGVDGEMLLLGLDVEGVCASSGSACSSGTLTPSHVLTALGRTPAEAAAAVRFSLGVSSTERDVDHAASCLSTVVRRMRRAVQTPRTVA